MKEEGGMRKEESLKRIILQKIQIAIKRNKAKTIQERGVASDGVVKERDVCCNIRRQMYPVKAH